MTETSIAQEFEQITAKVKKMKARITRLDAENAQLKTSVFSYLSQLEAQKQAQLALQQQAKNQQIAHNLSDSNKNLSKEIDKYILLIDKCIAAINIKL